MNRPAPRPQLEYVAQVRQVSRWGPWSWIITYTHGYCRIEGSFAWSQRRARAKAERRMAKWQTRDDRERSTLHTVVAKGNA